MNECPLKRDHFNLEMNHLPVPSIFKGKKCFVFLGCKKNLRPILSIGFFSFPMASSINLDHQNDPHFGPRSSQGACPCCGFDCKMDISSCLVGCWLCEDERFLTQKNTEGGNQNLSGKWGLDMKQQTHIKIFQRNCFFFFPGGLLQPSNPIFWH